MELALFAQIIAKAGEETRLHQELQRLVTATRQEPGCIDYKLHLDINDSKVFWMYEIWQSIAALDSHMTSEHMQAFLAHIDTLVSDIKLHKTTAD